MIDVQWAARNGHKHACVLADSRPAWYDNGGVTLSIYRQNDESQTMSLPIDSDASLQGILRLIIEP